MFTHFGFANWTPARFVGHCFVCFWFLLSKILLLMLTVKTLTRLHFAASDLGLHCLERFLLEVRHCIWKYDSKPKNLIVWWLMTSGFVFFSRVLLSYQNDERLILKKKSKLNGAYSNYLHFMGVLQSSFYSFYSFVECSYSKVVWGNACSYIRAFTM